eukprot:6020440-Prymnesium_polylepis.1
MSSALACLLPAAVGAALAALRPRRRRRRRARATPSAERDRTRHACMRRTLCWQGQYTTRDAREGAHQGGGLHTAGAGRCVWPDRPALLL